MSLETHQLYASAAKAIGHKRMASALSVSLAHTYVLSADPLAVEAPVRNDVERLTNLIEALASHPNAKPTLILFRLYFNELFARVIDRETHPPLTPEMIVAKAQKLCVEVSDVLAECKPDFCPERIAKEASELVAVLERLISMAEASDDVPQTKPIRVAR